LLHQETHKSNNKKSHEIAEFSFSIATNPVLNKKMENARFYLLPNLGVFDAETGYDAAALLLTVLDAHADVEATGDVEPKVALRL
jgi:hypothetical protein